MRKVVLPWLLTLLIIIAFIPVSSFAIDVQEGIESTESTNNSVTKDNEKSDVDSNGTIGNNIIWTLYSDGLMELSGTGKMNTDNPYYAENRWWGTNSIKNKIKKIVIGDGITSIGDCAFMYLDKMTVIDIPDSVTEIGYCAFQDCSSLEEISLSNNITSIGDHAFLGCRSLSGIRIPKNVVNIGVGICGLCDNVTAIEVDENNTHYIADDGVLMTIDGEKVISCPSGKNGEYSIPEGAETIGAYAFRGSKLSNIVIPDTVTTIEEFAFQDSDIIDSITIPSNTKSIAGYAFSLCDNLSNVTISEGVERICALAFWDCPSLKEITIPASVTNIGFSSFREDNVTITILNKNISFGTGDYPDDMAPIPFAAMSGEVKYPCNSVNLPSDSDVIKWTPIHTKGSSEGVVVAPKCEEQGYTDYVCETCGEPFIDDIVSPLGHDLVKIPAIEETCTMDGKIEHCECQRCKKVFSDETGAVELDDADLIVPAAHMLIHHDAEEPSCTEVGWNEYDTCSRCDYSTYEEKPALGHDYNDTVVAPTCTEKGFTLHECSRCFNSFKDSYTDALNHSWGMPIYEWVDYTSVTATRTCNNDDSHKETETVNTTSKITKAATYTAKGQRTYTATFSNPAFETQTKVVTNVPMLARTSISKASVSNVKAKVYTGKTLTQVPTVKVGTKTLKSGTDYKLTYSKNKYVGTAKVTITGVGAYKDSISKTFKINPKSTSMTSVTAVRKGFTAKWKKQATQTTGYQLQYALNSKFTSGKKTLTIGKNTTVSKKVTKLKAKKRYYVRVRTYKTVSGVRYYSSWSAYKYVTTKK